MGSQSAAAPAPVFHPQPVNPEVCKEMIRKDLRHALVHCKIDSGRWRCTITPARIIIRTNERSELRTDFAEQVNCNNSIIVRDLYRQVAQEQEFKGISVSFNHEWLEPKIREDSFTERIHLLVVMFSVPKALRKSRGPLRKIHA
jgi:hypothetical protein